MPSPTPTATLPSAVLPICQDITGIELGELTLAFVADWDGDDEIYIIQADGSNLTQLTYNTSGDVSPMWSPNGQQIAYIVEAYSKPNLYISNADGSGGRIVPSGLEVSSMEAVWSPIGDKMAFRNNDDLYVVDVETGEVVNLTRTIDYAVGMTRFSPDGSTLAFRANVLGEIPQYRLFVVNADGTDLRELSFPQGDVYEFSWHPLEEQILFYGTSQAEGTRLYATSPDGMILDLGIDGQFRPPMPTFSSDGTMIAYIDRSSAPPPEPGGLPLTFDTLHVVTKDLEIDLSLLQPPEDPNVEFYLTDLQWTPNNRHIAYSIPSETGGSGEVDLYVLDICDGTSSLIVEAIDAFSTPSWTTGRITGVTPIATEVAFDFTDYADKWLTYQNERYGFSFEYPAVYTAEPYAYCNLQEVPIQDGVMITIGMRSDLYVFDAQGQTIEEYVDLTIEDNQKGDPDWELINRKETNQAGVDAISIDYRFGSLSRLASAKVFKRGTDMYVFNFTFGAFCDVPELEFYEWDAYPRMVSSFMWIDE